ncbi:MAG: hypothetical protein RL189_1045 [Pseudomonadota bacterium]|jgi:GDP-L-fucose synthase
MMGTGLRKEDKIFVAGHRGLVGSALVEVLEQKGYKNIVTRTRQELDLCNQAAVDAFYDEAKPDVVFMAAAKVGGIHANNAYRADFIGENLQIQNNVIWGAHRANVRRLVFLGSSCIYPRNCPQPMKEEYLLTGELEYTNRPYAIAKIAGLELVNSIRQQYGRDWFSVMPTNLYGPRDNFHPENSHVLPALIRRFEEARLSGAQRVTVWGTGKPRREFMYSLDCALAIIELAELTTLNDNFKKYFNDKFSHINIGVGEDVSISELANIVAESIEFDGAIEFNALMPDGTPKKLQDVTLLKALTNVEANSLKCGLMETISWFRNQKY